MGIPSHKYPLAADAPVKAAIGASWEDGQVRYRIVVQNTGETDVQSVAIRSTFSFGCKLASYSGPAEPRTTRNFISWSLPVLPKGGLELFEYVATTSASNPGDVKPAKLTVHWAKTTGPSTVSLQVKVGDYSGGTNEAISKYLNPSGFPPYAPAGIDLGVLRGSWHQIGVQHAQRTGKLVQLYFDDRFAVAVKALGSVEHVVEDVRRYNVEVQKFSPQAVEFMKGIAEGAAPYLKKSKYASALTDYQKILFMNCEFCLMYGHPGPEAHFPLTGITGKSEHNPVQVAVGQLLLQSTIKQEKQEDGCTAMVVLGTATKDKKTIFSHNNDNPFFPRIHRMNYIAIPDEPGAHPYWATAEPGKICSLGAVNSKGVAAVILAGPGRTWVPEENIFERSFGVPWPIGQFMQAAYANSRQEAVDMIVLGTPEYRLKTGRSTLLRARQNNWLIADKEHACVVEATAHKYAVRYPGDNGEDGYIVTANHFVANFSYNENNQRTDFPMTKFGDENNQVASTPRYYTLWWLNKLNRGSIDVDKVKEFHRSHFYITKQGNRVDNVWDPKNGWVPAHLGSGSTVCCHADGYPEKYTGNTVDSKVAVLNDRIIHWALGRPCEWVGLWRVYQVPEH
jgi:hypothetical protein